MLKLKEYQITEELYHSEGTIVYRGIRQSDGAQVILKYLNEEFPSPISLGRFQSEYELLKELEGHGVPQVYALEKVEQSVLLVMRDDQATFSLKQLIERQTLSLAQMLDYAIQIAETLGKIHKKGIIHKDIKPHNIVLISESSQLILIDFGIATRLKEETTDIDISTAVEGTMAYISPEQTGRMNRCVDYRTDLYSLGVTFYELFGKELPFQAKDSMGWIHCHIAQAPQRLAEKNLQIPGILSDIIQKLLNKNAEDRYQSAYGLKTDLEICLRQLRDLGTIAPFELAERDVSERFQLPQKLYGREGQVKELLQVFNRVTQGNQELIIVTGNAGIGKSSVVREMTKALVPGGGFFISGKYDEFKRNDPYSGIVQAFSELIQELLTQSDAELTRWKENLQEALGVNGKVISEIIPDLELIIGPQPAIPKLEPVETQNRFQVMFRQFINVFTQKGYPLVIFLDDVHCSDTPSLNLLSLLLSDPDIKYLLTIVAFREQAVEQNHPFKEILKQIEQKIHHVCNLVVSSLEQISLNQLIADTTHQSVDATQELAKIVMQKTGGNPFFIREFLKTIHGEKLLVFDHEQMLWTWDMAKIEAQETTGNVVELMIGKIRKLPERTQAALRLGACIGPSFDLQMLAIIANRTLLQIADDLWPAVEGGLLMPVGEGHRLFKEVSDHAEGELINPSSTQGPRKIIDKFTHGRVQKAAYGLIPEDERQGVHLQIGRMLWANLKEETLGDDIFYLLSQLNPGRRLIESTEEKVRLSQLNLKACLKAKALTAYGPAMGHALIGVDSLPEACWTTHYELTLALYNQVIETSYLNIETEQMNRFFNELLQRAKTHLDTVEAYEVLIQAFAAQNQFQKAVVTSLSVLKHLGVSMPANPTAIHVGISLLQTKWALRKKTHEALLNLPLMTDQKKLILMRILFRSIPAAYVASANLFALVIFQMVRLAVKQGNCGPAAFAYSAYGAIHSGALGDFRTGYAFGELAIKLAEKLEAKEAKVKIIFANAAGILQWQVHLKESLLLLAEGIQIGWDISDLEYALYACSTYCNHQLFLGEPLPELRERYRKDIGLAFKYKQRHTPYYMNSYAQWVQNLLEVTENPSRFKGEFFDEDTMFPLMLKNENFTGLFFAYKSKAMMNYLFRDYDSALNNLKEARKYLENVLGMMGTVYYNFYSSLVWIARIREGTTKRFWGKLWVHFNQRKMKTWMKHSPENFTHKYFLIEAEKARIDGEIRKAMDYYELAINAAAESEYIIEEALGNELAGEFYLSLEKGRIAQSYLIKAWYLYGKWGAANKQQDLEKRYSYLLKQRQTNTAVTNLNSPAEMTTMATSYKTVMATTVQSLDLDTVMKASQAISGEIELGTLLRKLMTIVVENAGADKALLILKAEASGEFFIQAEYFIDREKIEVLQKTSIFKYDQIPISVIQYAIRTQDDVVLNDAMHEGNFTRDAYILKQQPKSVLCAPILNHGNLTGLLYLENNLTVGAFTRNHLKVLNMLSSQAAISIENAVLYANLADNVRREQELKTAAAIQKALLPKRLPQIRNMDIASRFTSASETGGDWYGFITKIQNTLALLIGDVTGHGTPAALVTATASATCLVLENLYAHQPCLKDLSPSIILKHLNEAVFESGSPNYLMTFFAGCLDLKTGTMRYANASHNFPLLIQKDDKVKRLLNKGSRLGHFQDSAYQEKEVQLEQGDLLFFYTDGLTENESPDGEQWGERQLIQYLKQNKKQTSQKIVDGLMEKVVEFNGGTPLNDDVTMTVCRILAPF
ncbi:SpoIIE family protein phosphatase [Deltaproteobacteria bacterium TL4]